MQQHAELPCRGNTFSTLNERQRRLFAASEALKLGHGGNVYVAQLLNCH